MEGFIDGALFHNNPVRIANYESKLLWPDAEEHHPDILLSIGTGHNGVESDDLQSATKFDRRHLHLRKVLNQVKPSMEEKRSIPGLRAFNEIESLISMFKKRAESVLNAELTWKEFRKDVVGTSSPIAAERYIRLNPRTLHRTPKMDDKAQIQTLHDEIKSGLNTHGMRTKIEGIAHRLVASSFYFEKQGPPREVGDLVTIQGAVQCRFGSGSDNLRYLGDYIRKHQRPSFQPFFHVKEVKHEESAQDIFITAKIIHEMIDRGLFYLESVAIPMTSESSLLSIDLHLTDDRMKPHVRPGFPISGFPRILADGEPLKKSTSPPSPNPERPMMSTKRQSLREKRQAHTRRSLEQPASDSDISCTMHNKMAAARNHGLGPPFPETPEDIPDWVRRRGETSRRPPKPVEQEEHYIPQPLPLPVFHELDAGPWKLLDAEHEGLVQAFELDGREDGGGGRSIQDTRSPRRTETGTNEEELAKALELSMHVR